MKPTEKLKKKSFWGIFDPIFGSSPARTEQPQIYFSRPPAWSCWLEKRCWVDGPLPPAGTLLRPIHHKYEQTLQSKVQSSVGLWLGLCLAVAGPSWLHFQAQNFHGWIRRRPNSNQKKSCSWLQPQPATTSHGSNQTDSNHPRCKSPPQNDKGPLVLRRHLCPNHYPLRHD